MTAIKARGVRVRLGRVQVLDGIDLDVGTGDFVAVVGPNGAGKTTLLRAMSGLVDFEGHITVGDLPTETLKRAERARKVALVPQNPIVPPGMRIAEYVLLGRTPYLAPLAAEGASDVEVAHWALAELDLLTLADRTMDQLSGGELQRTFLARALTQQSPILLLDEPTTALDIGHQQEVLELVDTLRRSRGLTVVATMHDLTLAGLYADRLLLIDGGRVVVDGPPDAVLTEENLTLYYGADVDVLASPHGPIVVPTRASLPLDPS